MGKIIVRKVKGMSLKVKISLVLLFTMLFSTFIYQGWYKPKSGAAAATAILDGAAAAMSTSEAIIGTLPTTLPAGDNLIIAIVSMRNTNFTSDAFAANAIKLRRGGVAGTLLTQTLHPFEIGGGTTPSSTVFPDAYQYLVYRDAGAAANQTYTVTGISPSTNTNAAVKLLVINKPPASASVIGTSTAVGITATTLATVTPGFTGSNVVIASVELNNTNASARSLAATTGLRLLKDGATVLDDNQFQIDLNVTGSPKNSMGYLLIGVDSSAVAGSAYSVSATGSATGINGNAKIIVMNGMNGATMTDGGTVVVGTSTTQASQTTTYGAGDNVIITSQQYKGTSGTTARTIAANAAGLDYGGAFVSTNDHIINTGITTSAPATDMTAGTLYVHNGAPATPTYDVVATSSGSLNGNARILSFQLPTDKLTTSAATNLTTANPADGAQGLDMLRFQVDSNNALDGQVELSSLTMADSGTATSIANAKVYISATSQATLPAGATLIGSVSTWDGSSTVISLTGGTAADRTVTNGTPKYIYIVYDLDAANTGQGTLTIQPQVTAVNVASPDQGATGLNYQSTIRTIQGAAGTAKTYYADNRTATAVGVDGTTDMTALADIAVTDGGSNENRIMMDNTVPTGTTTTYRVVESAAATRTDQEFFRSYTPVYASATTIGGNVSAYASLVMRATGGTSAVAKATLYEYDDLTGIVGTAKGTASYTLNPALSTTTLQTMNNVSFGNAPFTMAPGSRLMVVWSFDMVATRPAYLWGQASSATPTGYQGISIIETTIPGDTLTTSLPTNLTTANPNDGTQNIDMLRFQLASNNGANGNVEVSTLTLANSGTATSITKAEVYISTVSQATLPGAAVLIGSVSSWDGSSTVISLTGGTVADRTVTTGTPKFIYIVYDLATGQANNTIQAQVTKVGVKTPDISATGLNYQSTVRTIQAVPVFAFSAANYNKTEGNSGTSTATITVNRSVITTGTNTVNYATSDGTATIADNDYVAASGTLTFNPGDTSKTFTVTVNGDTKYDADETVNLTLSSPSGGATIASPNPATLTIVNDDPLPSVGFYLPTTVWVLQNGAQALIPVSLAAVSGSPVSVTVNTANGTALSGTNYTAVTNGTLTFNPGEVSKNIQIPLITGDNKTFTVTISSPVNAILGKITVNTVTMFAKFPSTITACSGCHGTTSAFADGATRNNPANTFPGSHNEHVITYGYACSTCHVAPGATSYNHRNGTINMAVNINGDTGGAYGKGTSWTQVNPPAAFLACSNTYCHSQGTSKTSNAGETRTTTMSAPTATLNWGSAGSCDSCHGYPPSYATGTTTWGAAKANSHVKHDAFKCYVCHHRTTDDGITIASLARHANRFYNISAIGAAGLATFSYTYNAAGSGCGTIYCHNLAGASQSGTWGGTITLGCIDCHSKTIYRTNGRPGDILDAIKSEFNLAWGHRNTARTTANGAVTSADCIVCHLEGNYTTQKPSEYHADGNIDLRDPRGSGETPITNLTGGAFTFQRFSTSFAAGSRTTTGHLNNADIAQVISIKFCLGCHRDGGATNTTARSNNGGTGTASMPFGGINLGANYTVANGATASGGLVNVFSQFSSGNSSRHPVRAPNTRDFPTADRLAAPYDNQEAGRIDAGGVRTQSVVMTCFDCHNTTGKLTTRTVAAHGNAVSLRGTYYVASPTLCTTCHGGSATYATGSSTDHGAGSALFNSSNQVSMTNCSNCHASATSKPARPVPAQDYHGYNRLAGSGTDALWPTGATETSRPYAFIRNTANLSNHRPFRSSEFTSGSATCTTTGSCQGGTYTTGGTY